MVSQSMYQIIRWHACMMYILCLYSAFLFVLCLCFDAHISAISKCFNILGRSSCGPELEGSIKIVISDLLSFWKHIWKEACLKFLWSRVGRINKNSNQWLAFFLKTYLKGGLFDICFDAHIAGFSDCINIVGRSSCFLEFETSVVRFWDALRPFFWQTQQCSYSIE